MTSRGAAPRPRRPAPGPVRRALPVGVMVAVVSLVGLGAFTQWDDWFVNHDGTSYLTLAHNLANGRGYVFPDGSTATFRGPVYPMTIALSWGVLEESARSAIWAGRALLLGIPALSALMITRLTKRPISGATAGVLAAVQPVALIAGGLYFVPDGLAALWVLAALTVVVWPFPAAPSSWAYLTAGAILGLGTLTKESAMVGFVIVVAYSAAAPGGGLLAALVGAVLAAFGAGTVLAPWWVFLATGGEAPGTLLCLTAVAVLAAGAALARWPTRLLGAGRGRRLPPRLAAVLTPVVTYAAISITISWPVWTEHTLERVGRDLQAQLFGETPWQWLAAVAALGLVWAAIRLDSPRYLAPTLATAAALGLFGWLAALGLASRNAALAPYCLVLIFSLMVDDLLSPGRLRTTRGFAAVVLVGVALWGSVRTSAAVNDRLPGEDLSAESPVTHAAAAWLTENAAGAQVAGSPLYVQSMWRIANGEFSLVIAPFHVMSTTAYEDGADPFRRTRSWAGLDRVSPPDGRELAVIINRASVGAQYDEQLAGFLTEHQVAYFVVTGNHRHPSSAVDGGGLLPALETARGLEAVYRSHPMSAQWVVIYRVTGEVTFLEPVTCIQVAAPEIEARTVGRPDWLLMVPFEYSRMVRRILSRPVDD